MFYLIEGKFLRCFYSTNLTLSWNMEVHTPHLGYLTFPKTWLDCLIFTFWRLNLMVMPLSKHSAKVLNCTQTLKCYW